MNNYMESLRGTGRTSRLIEDAQRLSKEGRAVYIVADNWIDANRIQILLGDESNGIKVETPSTLREIDWETLSIRGMHSNCVVLFDHHAIEDRFGPLLEMLHRYDK